MKLRIYDVNGRLVRKLVDGSLAAGPDGRCTLTRRVTSGTRFEMSSNLLVSGKNAAFAHADR